MKELAPIAVFAFNRPKELYETLSSLRNNDQAKDSNLYVFIDGPRGKQDIENVNAVIDICKNIQGFKNVQIKISEHNKGLAPSIISGVSELIDKYGKIIVVEDDLYVSQSFLTYMNQMLDKYENENKVFQVSGFGVKIHTPESYKYDVYYNVRAQCWTWGTWRDRWNSIDWDIKDYNILINNKKAQREFNKAGSDMFGMLMKYKKGLISSWYIRFCYSMFKQNKLCVCPIRSLVVNNGFGDNATHCRNYNRYKTDFDKIGKNKYITPEPPIIVNKNIQNQVLFYWSIPYRIYGKLMTYLSKIGLN